jgi:type VI secretion system protein ImpJ
MASYLPIHWHEGMFLRPQHFQAAERHVHQQIERAHKWDLHHNWGIRSIDINEDALAAYRFELRDLKGRLHDGTLVDLTSDASKLFLDLKSAFVERNEPNVTVYLAVPVLNLGRANVSHNGSLDTARYSTDGQDLEDENTGLNPQPVAIRRLNLKLLLSVQDMTGYVTLPIAKLKRADMAEGVPQLDKTYIPPLLACDAWRPLFTEILDNIMGRLNQKLEMISNQLVTRGVTWDSVAQGDRQLFEQVRIMNEGVAACRMLVTARGVHPFTMYLELCRLVGALAILGAQRRVPELPEYNHDDLATCFYTVKKYIDDYLGIIIEPEYKERPFRGAGLRMEVTGIDSQWLEAIWAMFVGVESPLPAEECRMLLTRAGKLDMKIGSSERVDEIFRRGEAGLRFAYTATPPRALPRKPGLIYFQIDRDSQKQEWDHVQRTLSVAIRVNERLIVGNIQGQRKLTINTGTQTTSMEFTLFVVKPDKTAAAPVRQ